MLSCDLCFHWDACISCLDDVSLTHFLMMMISILLDDVILCFTTSMLDLLMHFVACLLVTFLL